MVKEYTAVDGYVHYNVLFFLFLFCPFVQMQRFVLQILLITYNVARNQQWLVDITLIYSYKSTGV